MAAAMPVAMVVEGLVAHGPDGPRLMGARCEGCATTYFPDRDHCANPACDAGRMASTLLPARGTLYSYTLQRYMPPPPFRMDDWAPYLLGLVDLGEGVRVMAMLSGVDADTVRIGMPVHLVTETLFTDPETGPMATYKFAPVPAGEQGA